MELISAGAMAKRWGISRSRITVLCEEKRIPGARLEGDAWRIPADARKPAELEAGKGKGRNAPKPQTKKSKGPGFLEREEYLNQVIEADCLELLARIPDASVDMILCDLPYNTTQNDWDGFIPMQRLWPEYERIIRPNGVIALTGSGIFTARLIMSREKLFKYKIVWEKSKPTNFLNAKKQPLRKHEDICIFYKQQPVYHPQMTQGEAYDKGVRKNQLSGSYGEFSPVHVRSEGERYPTDIVYFKTAESEGTVYHPTQKPVELGRYLIRTYTDEGAVVLDNACGSGSFLVSALLEGRNFIGIEKNEDVALFKKGHIDYIKVCRERLRSAWKTLPEEKRRQVRRCGLLDWYAEEERVAMGKVRANERSWAITLIADINLFLQSVRIAIRRAGGEATISSGRVSMFPDVLLYGDEEQTRILQGWELKMPDTLITDDVFIKDAWRKADALGLNSCFIWNFTAGVLYVRGEDGKFHLERQWNDTSYIRTREDVTTYKKDWLSVLQDILLDINQLFDTGKLKAGRIADALGDAAVTAMIRRNQMITAENLRVEAARDAVMEARLNIWWKGVRQEYISDEADMYSAYAKTLLLGWANRILFAHLIKGRFSDARQVEKIVEGIPCHEGDRILKEVAGKCGFYHILRGDRYSEYLPYAAWQDLVDLNLLLTENGLDRIEQSVLQHVMENTVRAAKRQLAGQFTTPPTLAEILTAVTVRNYDKDCIDPCCGTGTIASALQAAKKSRLGSGPRAIETTWAGDKFSFPLQIAQIGLTDVENSRIPARIFQENVFDLKPGGQVIPTGEGEWSLPVFGAAVSNLPFVSFELIDPDEMDHIRGLNERLEEECGLPLNNRSDLYQYIPFVLWDILEPGGRMGIITSNSWLGTAAGHEFWKALTRYYHLEQVHISGKGRWFPNSQVVTVILVLSRRQAVGPPEHTESTVFCKWEKSLGELQASKEDRESLIQASLVGEELCPDQIAMKRYRHQTVEQLLDMGISLSALFHDASWLLEIRDKLCPLLDVFRVIRGERRGWDKMFYPKAAHGIEPMYLKKVLKNSRSVDKLTAKADSDAFCCSRTKTELAAAGHKGALRWIEKFESGVNNKGVPLPESLHRANMHWYEMQDSNTADLATSINPDRRLFFFRFQRASFINQRLIGLKTTQGFGDVELYHALLNSLLGLFFVEAVGFGRGLGALDINSKTLRSVYMWNPSLVDQRGRERILAAFEPLKGRGILPLEQELARADRIAFEREVLATYGADQFFDKIYRSLLSMHITRLNVKR